MPATVRLLLVWEINSPNFAAISRTSASTLIHLTVNLLRNYDANFLAYHDSQEFFMRSPLSYYVSILLGYSNIIIIQP